MSFIHCLLIDPSKFILLVVLINLLSIVVFSQNRLFTPPLAGVLDPTVGNQQPMASVALASHSQASWAQLPPPPPLAPVLGHSQQPEGQRHAQQQRDLREESEAHTVNKIMPESRHIY